MIFRLVFLFTERGADESEEQGMRAVGTALEFRVELYADEKVVGRNLNRFYSVSVRSETYEVHACGRENVLVFDIAQFVAVTVSFVYRILLIRPVH